MNFLPLPQKHGSLRPTFGAVAVADRWRAPTGAPSSRFVRSASARGADDAASTGAFRPLPAPFAAPEGASASPSGEGCVAAAGGGGGGVCVAFTRTLNTVRATCLRMFSCSWVYMS